MNYESFIRHTRGTSGSLYGVLENISFVKVKKVKTKKEKILKDLEEAVEESILIKGGKKQGRNAKDFIKELRGNNA